LATRALALATLGDLSALDAAADANAISSAAEVQGYALAATSLLRFRGGERASVVQPFEHAIATRIWDPLVSLLRAAPDFAAAAARQESTQHVLRGLCERIDDRALARQTKLRIRVASTPSDGRLSQRENEVLGLISLGFKNQDIARTLYISESTVKVHVRHIFEKLGVRTRAEAAARAN
jgi:ATP/maltotriose-dependent transcriptional regulator MalT